MKKYITCLLALLLVLSSLVGCATYKPAVDDLGSSRTTTGIQNTPAQPGGEEKGTPFTATVVYNGLPLTAAEGLFVQWTDGYRYYTAPVDATGRATVYGPDGDYRVTLLSLPKGYAYNPAAHTATNDTPHVEIELYKITPTMGSGKGLYTSEGCIRLTSTGVYQANVKEADKVVYYEFQPKVSGTYSIESWLDVNMAEINPKVDIYTGTFAFKLFKETKDDGGEAQGYTRNFRYEVELTEDMIGNVYTFGIHATSKDGTYPVKVNFAIQLNGEFERQESNPEMVLPTEDFQKTPDYDPDKYVFVGAETQVNGRNIFDGSMYRLSEEDGYYHLYDEEAYPETGGYGPILYAKITAPCRFLDASFTHIEDSGNKSLTIDGKENYKFFIEGHGVEAGYFCVAHAQNNVYCPCLATCGGMCLEGCAACHPQCRQVSAELLALKGGYADFVNTDGVYAVTEELKDFLQKFAISQRLFADGDGWVEENPNIKVDAMEEDQWLFACGYYKEK